MGPAGFERVRSRLQIDSPPADPATYWRTGFSLPAIAAGYAYDRPAVRETLLDRLRDEDVALVGGPGVGKSTTCRIVACAWHARDRGPVYHASGPSHGADADALAAQVSSVDGRALVVLEDADADDGTLAADLVATLGGRDDVALLLELEPGVLGGDGVGGDRLSPVLDDELSVYELPSLDRSGFVAAVETFESLTGEGLTPSPEAVFDRVRERGVEGNELLHLAYLVTTDRDAPESSLERTVRERHASHGGDDLVGDLAVLLAVLGAAELPPYPEFLFALDAPNSAVDDAVERLRGDLLTPRSGSPPFATPSRLFCALYLERVVESNDRPQERFATALAAIVAAMDPDRRDELWSWIVVNSQQVPDNRGDAPGESGFDLLQSPARTSQTAVGGRARVIEQVFAVGLSWPKLAPLFGSCEDDDPDLDAHCSPVTRVRAVLARGRMYFERGDHDRALAEFDRADSLLSSVPPRVRDRLEVECLVARGRVATRQAAFERARDAHREAHALAVDLGDRRGRARTHAHLGVVAMKRGDLHSATAHLVAAERLFRVVDDEHGVARALQRLGVVRMRRGDLDAAARDLDAALERFQGLGDRVSLARCRNNRALVAYRRGDLETAEAYVRRSMTANRESGRQDGVMKNRLNLGNFASERGDDEAAERHYRATLSLARDVGDRDTEATALNNLGVLAVERGDLDAAADRYRESLSVSEAIGDTRGVARARNNLGEVARERGDVDAAVTHHRRSLRLREAADDSLGRANCHLELGRCARARGDLATAHDRFERALSVFRDLGNERRAGETLAALGEIARARGDPETAFDRLAESVRLLDAGTTRQEALESLRDIVDAHDRPGWRDRLTALPAIDETVAGPTE